MNQKEFYSAAIGALRPTYRHLFLKTKGKKSPFIIMLNPGGNHFQFVALDLDNAVANHVADKPVDVFLVDSLDYSVAEMKATKFLILAAIHFMRQDFEWINAVVNEKGLSHRVAELETFPTPTVFLDELKSFKINIESESMAQTNGFDCGIFCILQMQRLSRHLYGVDDVSGFAGDTLRKSHVRDCLGQTINRGKPNQEHVEKWRTHEFLYLLSVWIKHVSDMIKEAGSLAVFNTTFQTDFKSIMKIPYIGVKYQGRSYYINAVTYAKLKVKIANGTDERTIQLKDKKWWNHMKFISSPSASDLPRQLIINFKKQTDTVQYVPSTSDLCRFYPGHISRVDKYIASDYLFWKLYLMDRRIVGHENPCANVGLCINSFHVGKTAKLLKSKKRKREEQLDLISDDEGEEGSQ